MDPAVTIPLDALEKLVAICIRSDGICKEEAEALELVEREIEMVRGMVERK